jgi:plastocyanin
MWRRPGGSRRRIVSAPVRRLAVPCASLLAFAACGGDDGDSGARSVTVKPNSTLPVSAKEYSFDPARVKVSGAGPLTIRLRNEGSLAHNLKLIRNGETVGGTPTFPGGESRSGRVNLERGRYEMVCTVGDHAELGMVGELEVK